MNPETSRRVAKALNRAKDHEERERWRAIIEQIDADADGTLDFDQLPGDVQRFVKRYE